MTQAVRRYFAPRAWIQGAWARDVVLSVAADGCWLNVLSNASQEQQRGAVRLGGPVLPGMVNAHSQALARALSGLTQCYRHADAASGLDSWQAPLRGLARRISPEQLEAVASLLYAELLQAGYTQVCEFHVLHGSGAGASSLDMGLALVRAAQRVGIGLTLLPALKTRVGFDGGLLPDALVAASPDTVLRVSEAVTRMAVDPATHKTSPGATLGAGVGVQALQSVDLAALQEVAAHARKVSLPVHMSAGDMPVAIADCERHLGRRPIGWVLDNLSPDARWNFVHATYATADELQGLRRAGSSIVLCPSTAADLGCGVFDLPAYAALGGRWSIGSGTHAVRQWTAELRLLEYVQRQRLHERNVAARGAGRESTAAVLFDAAVAGGRAATGQRMGAIQAGHRADFVIVDDQSAALVGVPGDHWLDAMVFSSPSPRLWDVFVAGQPVVTQGRVVGNNSTVPLWPQLAADYAQTMAVLRA